MRVLWITNLPIAHHNEMLGIGQAQSGGWMEASFEALKNCTEIQLGVVSIWYGKFLNSSRYGNHNFYLISRKDRNSIYDPDDTFNQQQWRNVIEDFHPDIIHVWGTENSYGLCAFRIAGGIPSIITIQGVMADIYKHYLSAISIDDIRKHRTIKEVLRNYGSWINKHIYQKIQAFENEMICHAGNVIVENKWTENYCKYYDTKCNVYNSLTPINKVFSEYSWKEEEAVTHRIFSVAGGYPIKGHHVLLKAFAHILKKFPDAELRLPGDYNYLNQPWYRQTPYARYINWLIKELDLKEHIVYLGKLSPEQMAKELKQANVFVMPSNAENICCSLLEAMMVGTPSVCAYVGGLSEYMKEGRNGIFYRQDEDCQLAMRVVSIFENKELAKNLSFNARNDTRQARLSINILNDFLSIYNCILR